jgi:hypothetical protein
MLLLKGAVVWLELKNKKLPYEILNEADERVWKIEQQLENLRNNPSGSSAEHADRVRNRLIGAKRRLESLSTAYLEAPEGSDSRNG